MEMGKRTGLPQIVKLDKAFKLAEQWVSNMSKVVEDEPKEAKIEGRPSGLGLGAKVSRQTKVAPSSDPLERRLNAKFDAQKRKVTTKLVESAPPRDVFDNDDGDDDDAEAESRSSAFSKKRTAVTSPPSIAGKKRRK